MPRCSVSSYEDHGGGHRNYKTSSLPVLAQVSRGGFYFFSLCSFLICFLMILYHSRVLSWSFFVRSNVIGERESDEEVNEHRFSSVLYSMGFGIDFVFLMFYLIQQKVNKPLDSPRKYYITYLGITLLFVVYFLSILTMFSMRTFGMIEQPISADFLLNFVLFETHVLCMTLSSAMKTIEFWIIDKCARKKDSFFLDEQWEHVPVLKNGGKLSAGSGPRYSLVEQKGSSVVMYL